jgi:hypothetical protein
MPRVALHIDRSVALAGLAGGMCLVNAPGGSILVSPAAAQDVVSISVEFHIALEPFGTCNHRARFGEVWVPAHRPASWRPYTVGHWVYTEPYGWYWIEDSDESDWGWIAYHYGRWYDDPDEGWVWIAGDAWSPAWIEWREGYDVIAWAPLPPDPVIVEIEVRPECWIFVQARDVVAPRIDTVVLPVHESVVYLQRTRVVNRTVMERDHNLAVNPGIPGRRGSNMRDHRAWQWCRNMRDDRVRSCNCDRRRIGMDRSRWRAGRAMRGRCGAAAAWCQPLLRGMRRYQSEASRFAARQWFLRRDRSIRSQHRPVRFVLHARRGKSLAPSVERKPALPPPILGVNLDCARSG